MPIRPLLLFCRCRERQGGKEHPVFLPDVPVAPSTKLSHLRFPLLFPLLPVPELPLRRLTLHVVFMKALSERHNRGVLVDPGS